MVKYNVYFTWLHLGGSKRLVFNLSIGISWTINQILKRFGEIGEKVVNIDIEPEVKNTPCHVEPVISERMYRPIKSAWLIMTLLTTVSRRQKILGSE